LKPTVPTSDAVRQRTRTPFRARWAEMLRSATATLPLVVVEVVIVVEYSYCALFGTLIRPFALRAATTTHV
jgi:hypothetical protein